MDIREPHKDEFCYCSDIAHTRIFSVPLRGKEKWVKISITPQNDNNDIQKCPVERDQEITLKVQIHFQKFLFLSPFPSIPHFLSPLSFPTVYLYILSVCLSLSILLPSLAYFSLIFFPHPPLSCVSLFPLSLLILSLRLSKYTYIL